MEGRDLVDWGCQEMDPHIRAKLERAFKDPKSAASGTTVIDRPAGRYDANAEPEGIIANPNDFYAGYHGSSILLVKDIGNYLNSYYPGWAWAVQLNEFGHMINITNGHLHPTYGARIRMEDIMYSPAKLQKTVMKEAGEILERFGMDRHGLTTKNLEILAEALRDAAGNCIPEISDLPDKKAATQADVARRLARGDIKIFHVNGETMVRIKK